MNNSIGVVIPCYLGGEITLKLISEILIYADNIVLIDDKCPFKTVKKKENETSRLNNKIF